MTNTNLNILGDKRTWNKIPNLAEQINKEVEEKENERKKAEKERKGKAETQEEQEKAEEKQEAREEFSFKDNIDYWRIQGVKYRNGIYTVNLAKSLLDNGSFKTQDEWVEYSKEAIQEGGFYTPDFPLFYSLSRAIYQNKDVNEKEIKEAKEFIKKQMFKRWLMTLTRIKYMPSGKDEVIHNYKMSNEYLIKTNFVGADEFIKNSTDTSYLEALLGTNDVNEINSTFKWLTGKDTYIWRLNSKPKNIGEVVASFYAYSDGAYLGCGGLPSGRDPSLGVFVCAESTSRKT